MTGPVPTTTDPPATEGGPPKPEPTFTQAQVNAIMASTKRDALKDVPTADELKALREAAAEHQKFLDGQKPDIERLTKETGEWKSKYEGEERSSKDKDVMLQRQRLAGDSQLPTKFWEFIKGTDEAAIKESIDGLLDTLGIKKPEGDGNPPPAGPRPPAPTQQQGNPGQPPAGGSMESGRSSYEKNHPVKRGDKK